MWYIHYGLHFIINHSLFKRQYQMCSKLHQISWKKYNGCMFKTNCLSIDHWYKKLGTKNGKNKFTCPIFDNKFLSLSKHSKSCPRDFIIPIKQEDIRDYNLWCFMSSGLIIDVIIMDLFSGTTEQKQIQQKGFIFQNKWW